MLDKLITKLEEKNMFLERNMLLKDIRLPTKRTKISIKSSRHWKSKDLTQLSLKRG
jgi:hypothetical protein